MRVTVFSFLLVLLTACGARAEEGPDGLYLMTRFAFGSLEMTVYHFTDGVIVRNPTGGAEGVEVGAERARRPSDVGTYAVSDNMMTVELDGRKVESELQPSDHGCFGFNGGIHCPVKPFGSDERIEGSYAGGASVGGGAVMSSTTIAFHDDGRYELSGTGSLSSSGSGVGMSASSSGQARGSYRIDGTSLTLTPEGGAARSYSTFPYDDGTEGAQPRRIYFGGGMLKRQD